MNLQTAQRMPSHVDLQSVTPRTPWHTPRHVTLERNGLVVALDPERPNWIATDVRGARILGWLDGRRSLDEVASLYARELGVDNAKAAWYVDRFVRTAKRRGFAAPEPFVTPAYPGRAHYLKPRLRELWVHTNNSCNLTCEHCLVMSGPDGGRGMAPDRLLALIDEAGSLGVQRFYFTGGEPFLRPDIFDLIDRTTSTIEAELHILTNGLLFEGAVLDRLRGQSPDRLRLQVSLDGASARTNDAVRGAGSFERILKGIRTLRGEGFAPTVSTVISNQNVGEMVEMVRLVAELGAASWHMLWLHKKGRSAELNGSFASPARIYAELRRAQEEAERLGVAIDNIEAYRQRVNGAPGSRVDLSNAAVESVCVYADGRVFPSAATVQYGSLALGRWEDGNLGELLRGSDVARRLQDLSVVDKPVCNTCRFRFICGGGDVEHAYSYSLGATSSDGAGYDRPRAS